MRRQAVVTPARRLRIRDMSESNRRALGMSVASLRTVVVLWPLMAVLEFWLWRGEGPRHGPWLLVAGCFLSAGSLAAWGALARIGRHRGDSDE